MNVIKNKRTKLKVGNTMEPVEVGNGASSSDVKRINRLLAGSTSQSAFPSNAWGNVINNIDRNAVDVQSFYTILSSATFYSNTSTYNIGDLVVTLPDYENRLPAQLYKCTTAVTVPEDFNLDHWEHTDLITLLTN